MTEFIGKATEYPMASNMEDMRISWLKNTVLWIAIITNDEYYARIKLQGMPLRNFTSPKICSESTFTLFIHPEPITEEEGKADKIYKINKE